MHHDVCLSCGCVLTYPLCALRVQYPKRQSAVHSIFWSCLLTYILCDYTHDQVLHSNENDDRSAAVSRKRVAERPLISAPTERLIMHCGLQLPMTVRIFTLA